ncbi:MAG: efflux RND transporter periplasmic adaptor subunit [Bacteroidia bacterium]|nr:MAG: efflux RND transporter periplasmic adaptor subunit [Bacteroidia bacterium]
MKNAYITLAAVSLILFGCNNNNQNLEADIEIPVSVEDIRLKPIEEFISTTGTIYPVVDVEINTQLTARYYLERNPRTGKKWELGDIIKQGEIIARLEDEEYVNNIKLEVYELNLELAESELQKQQSLYEKGGVTLKDLKDAGSNHMNARYSLENARLQVEKMKVISSFDGVITNLPYYTQGSQVETNSVVAGIMDYKTMHLDINLPEKYASEIKTGQVVRVTNYTLPEDTITGQISQLSPAINPETRTFQGNIVINNPSLLLKPGMFVKADIITARADSAIVIPKDIILSRQRGMTVFIVNRGVANERVIFTGLENASEVEVVNGLQVNERVVTEGFETLSNNAKVTIIK